MIAIPKAAWKGLSSLHDPHWKLCCPPKNAWHHKALLIEFLNSAGLADAAMQDCIQSNLMC
jgi:hypothetical protein